jgi:hypothetical protein
MAGCVASVRTCTNHNNSLGKVSTDPKSARLLISPPWRLGFLILDSDLRLQIARIVSELEQWPLCLKALQMRMSESVNIRQSKSIDKNGPLNQYWHSKIFEKANEPDRTPITKWRLDTLRYL